MGSTKRLIQLSVGVAISASFLWFAFRDVAFADVWASMRAANIWGLVAVAGVGLLGIVSRAQRWVYLFRPGTGVTSWHGFVAQSIGFAGNTGLPFRAGEPLKAYALTQRTHQSFTKVLATVFLGRVSEEPRVQDTRAQDAELVKRSAAGDTDAFRQLYEAKHRRVYLVAYQIVGDSGLAEDVVQETFVALWKRCGRYRSRFAVDTWLNRIATNRAIDRWRSEKKHPRFVVDAEHTSSADESRPGQAVSATSATGPVSADPSLPARWSEVQAIWDELAAELSPQQRAAFVLREIEELPVRDVADVMECSVSTVRSHISLARKTLREALAEKFPELALSEGRAQVSSDVDVGGLGGGR